MIASLIALVVWLIVIGLVFWLLTYLVENIPLPEPFGRVAKVILLVVAVLIVILLLLQFAGIVDGSMPRLR